MESRFVSYIQYFENLTQESVGDLRQVATEDLHFVDPFNDVRDVEHVIKSLRQMYRLLKDPSFKIDLLITNAGTHIESFPEDFKVNDYVDIMNLNYIGSLNCLQAVLPAMVKRRDGYIAGVASLAGYRGLPRAAAYGASKAALIHFLESSSFHLRRHGIKVSIINPGFVKTPLTDLNDFHMPFLIESEKAAEIIVDGLKKQKHEISFPIPFNWILKFNRIIPYPLYDFLVDKFVWRDKR